jgi:CheY-like chemotaxis protein
MKHQEEDVRQKILLVDDDKGIVEVVKKVLEEIEYDVVTAYDGKEGLEKVKCDDPDLIVLDIRMPLMNGYEFMRALREEKFNQNTPMIPVIMLTAKEEMKEVFKMEGAKGYLLKPVDPTSLIRKIQECLNPDE